jgi:uncharacterized protein (DUF2141 family)
MKFNKITYFLIAFFLFTVHFMNAQKTCNLKVEVVGLKNTQGQIMVSLSRGPNGWPEENILEQRYITEFTAPNFTIYFNNLPYGNYAIGLMHDKDMDGEMSKNWIGMPKESFAFSRNYKVIFRAPKYDEANFELETPKKTITIKMQF